MALAAQFEQGRLRRMAQSIGDDIGRFWLTVIGVVAAAAIVGLFSFVMWSVGTITHLTDSIDGPDGIRSTLNDVKQQLRYLNEHRP